jgi:predicted RNase H-like HicB family nuclease
MQSQQGYTSVIRPDDHGTFMTNIPAMLGYHPWGKTPEQSRGEMIDVFEMIQQEYEEHERSLPDNVELVTDEERHQLR